MYKIEFKHRDVDESVTLSSTPLETLEEAIVFARGKLAQRFGSTNLRIRHHVGCCYRIYDGGLYIGAICISQVEG